MNADNAHPVLSIDIGNSMTKAGVVDTRSWICRARLTFATAALCDRLADTVDELSTVFSGERGVPVAVANVAGVAMHDVEQSLAGKHLGPLVAVVFDPCLPLTFDYRDPSVLGADRIANALYCRRCRPERDTIVVAAGTAVTVDLVTAAGHFAGGAILPGPGTQLRSLHAAASALPEVLSADVKALRPGTSTEECMSVGVLASVAGGIEKLAEQFRRTRSGPVDVVATGGAWPAVAAVSGLACTHVPDATLIGAAAFAVCKAESAQSVDT